MSNISDEKLQEFVCKLEDGDIVVYYWGDECNLINSEIADCLIELQTIREDHKTLWRRYLKKARQNKTLIDISNKMAELLSDGAMPPPDSLCIVDYFHARDMVYEHAHIMEEINE